TNLNDAGYWYNWPSLAFTPAMMPKMMPRAQAARTPMMPMATQIVTQPIRPTIDQVIWKLSALTACARTVADWLPLASSAINGATQPKTAPRKNIPAAPPKCATSAQAFSSPLAYPGGGGEAIGGGGGRGGDI